jgi:hypothetical protein
MNNQRSCVRSGVICKTGVDVMITIFCDIRQFSAKKLAFFSKTIVMIKILHNLALFLSQKRQCFVLNFLAKILKIHNIGPWLLFIISFVCIPALVAVIVPAVIVITMLCR